MGSDMCTLSGAEYVPAMEKARSEGRTLTEVVAEALVAYVGDDEWPTEILS